MNTEQTDNLTITIVIPACNAGKYISRAIDSVLAQTRPADEIIVIDDGSTDDTADIVAQYENKVKCIYQQNAGPSAARNSGIDAAQSQWIAFLDSDDQWHADKLEKQILLLKRNEDLVWVTSNYTRCLCHEKRKAPAIPSEVISDLTQGKERCDNFFTAFAQGAYGCTDTLLVKREVLKQVNGFQANQRNAEDMDLWWKIAYLYPSIGFVNEPLATYHLDVTDSISHTEQNWDQYRKMIERHIELSKSHNKFDDFKPCAVKMLKVWIRSMLFNANSADIRKFLDQFNDLLPNGYCIFMKTLTAFPKTTAACCCMISSITRKLKLRRSITRKPVKHE